ncbi:MAG: glycosyltransferase, partial [Phaeodactylibacter sp.]|nr:glycosyltransferase [Phaeodactylibacter sp.]
MTSVIAYAVLAIYTVALLYITVYCLMQFSLLYHYKKHQRDVEQPSAEPDIRRRAFAREVAVAAAPNHKHANARRQNAEVGLLEEEEEKPAFPFVTVQLPIYNEMYVVERLIDNIARFDYPRECFEIHVLDDSTDETVDIVRRKVQEYKAKGLQIEQIRREKRQGFKAGALR